MWNLEKARDRAEQELEEAYQNGEVTNSEYNLYMRQIEEEYRERNCNCEGY